MHRPVDGIAVVLDGFAVSGLRYVGQGAGAGRVCRRQWRAAAAAAAAVQVSSPAGLRCVPAASMHTALTLPLPAGPTTSCANFIGLQRSARRLGCRRHSRVIYSPLQVLNKCRARMHGTPARRDADQSNGGAQAFALIGIGPDRTIARQHTGLGVQHARMSSGLAQRQQLAGLGGRQAFTSRQLRTQAAAGRPGRCRLACAAAGERSRSPQRQAWHGMHAVSF